MKYEEILRAYHLLKRIEQGAKLDSDEIQQVLRILLTRFIEQNYP